MKKLISTALLCFVLYSPARAQEADLAALTLEDLLNVPIEAAGVAGEKTRDSAALAQVITGETIKARGYSTLLDLLEDIPQIEIAHSAETGRENLLTVQGLNSNERFQIMIDGIRVTPITGNLYSMGRQFSLKNAKRVEIILGPVSALYGADAFSGLVNIVTRTGAELKGAGAGAAYGSYGTFESAVAGGGGGADASAAATAHLYHSDRPYLPGYYKKEFAWYNNQYRSGQMLAADNTTVVNGIPFRRYNSDEDASFLHGRLNLGSFELGWVEMTEAHSTSLSVKPQFTLYRRDTVWKSRVRTVYGRHIYAPEGRDWELSSVLSRQFYELDPVSQFINNYSAYAPAYKYAMDESNSLAEKFTLQLGERGILSLGLDYQEYVSLPRTEDLPRPFNRDLSAASQNFIYPGSDVIASTMAIVQDFYYTRYSNIGAYGQYQIRTAGGTQFTLGTRYDHNSRYGDSLNPRGGIVLRPAEKLNLKLLYGEAFLAPAPDKAYQHFGSFAPNGAGDIKSYFFHLPNPGLKPEKNRSSQAEASYQFNDRTWLTLNAYWSYVSNLHQFVYPGPGTFKGKVVDTVEIWGNRGHANLAGTTLRLDALSSLGALRLHSYAAYTYSDGNIDGGFLPYSASASVKAGTDLSYGKWTVSTRLIYQSRSYNEQRDDSGARQSSPPFAIVNLSARCSGLTTGPVRLSSYLDIRNLTNARYYNPGKGGTVGFGAVPQDPISATAGITLEF